MRAIVLARLAALRASLRLAIPSLSRESPPVIPSEGSASALNDVVEVLQNACSQRTGAGLLLYSENTADMRKGKYWSAEVTEKSNALDLEEDVFKLRSAKAIALSLKASAEHSRRRKATPFQSAMSMLNFYINRAGKHLPASRKRTLECAKNELRKAFGRE